jgi:hypothetical protein
MLGLRWSEHWQIAILIIAPFLLLVAYVVWTYLLVKGRNLHFIQLKLIALAALFTIVWIVADALLFGFARMGTSEAVAESSRRATIGWPFQISEVVLQHFHLHNWLRTVVLLLPLFLLLWLLGIFVALTQKSLAKTRFAIEQHHKAYMGVVAGIPAGVLLVLLWPLPGRNPEMPTVPIPEYASSVRYTHTADEHNWPVTIFSLGISPVHSLLGYYQEVLVADGWQLEYSEGQQDPSGGSGTGKALLSLGDEVLEVTVVTSYFGSNVETVKHPATAEELARLAALPKPTATPTLEPPPPPVQTIIPALPTVNGPVPTQP